MKNHLSFEKKPKFRTFWESYQFCRILWQICYLWRFLKNWRVFLKDTSKFNKKPKILTLNVSRILAIPVAFYGKFAGYSNFSKRQIFFSKIPSMFWKKNPIFERFQESCNFSRILKQTCNLWHFLKIHVFLGRTQLFFDKKPKFWKFWEILHFQSHSTANLFPLAILKNSNFFWKTSMFY